MVVVVVVVEVILPRSPKPILSGVMDKREASVDSELIASKSRMPDDLTFSSSLALFVKPVYDRAHTVRCVPAAVVLLAINEECLLAGILVSSFPLSDFSILFVSLLRERLRSATLNRPFPILESGFWQAGTMREVRELIFVWKAILLDILIAYFFGEIKF